MDQTNTLTTRPFRAEDWWMSKASSIMGLVYVYTLWFKIPFLTFIPLSALSIVTISGFASFGYWMNDYFDQDKDRLAGKKNFLLGKPTSLKVILALIPILLIALPWIYLPRNSAILALIAIELMLFLLYSCPPIRLKERGLVGIVVDAAYAHGVPAILAAATFALASTFEIPYPLFGLIFLWQIICGIRNILIHQIEDKESDILTRTETYTTSIETATGIKTIKVLILIEATCAIVLFSLLTLTYYPFIYCLIVLMVLLCFGIFRYFGSDSDLLPHLSIRYFPNAIYEKWLPVVCLILLTRTNYWFAIFLILHILVFDLGYYKNTAWHFLKKIVIPIRAFFSKMVNNAIYYLLLLFHIDLKREEMSAIEYFRKKMRKD
jgi:1,4-dihydroxy-2-naphthoate octaprenyltransferase